MMDANATEDWIRGKDDEWLRMYGIAFPPDLAGMKAFASERGIPTDHLEKLGRGRAVAMVEGYLDRGATASVHLTPAQRSILDVLAKLCEATDRYFTWADVAAASHGAVEEQTCNNQSSDLQAMGLIHKSPSGRGFRRSTGNRYRVGT